MTAVHRKTEPVTLKAVLMITFPPSLTVRRLGHRQIWKVLTNTTWCTRPMTS